MYKYRGDDGEWIYSDRPPDEGQTVEVRSFDAKPAKGTVTVTKELVGDNLQIRAHNGLHAPVEVALRFNRIEGVEYPHPDDRLRWVLPPLSDLTLLSLAVLGEAAAPDVDYRFDYLPGDPSAVHRAPDGYRVPYSAGSNYPITQAYPDAVTHRTLESRYAVDIAMPIGTDVLAARGGIVFDVVGDSFRGGVRRKEHAHAANVVRILHDDGTFAVYAHLHWDSIRVRPGERVRAGQYIADSGNTGYSSGPHLHFAVQRNAGMRIEALPVEFRGADSGRVVPATGNVLTAYP